MLVHSTISHSQRNQPELIGERLGTIKRVKGGTEAQSPEVDADFYVDW